MPTLVAYDRLKATLTIRESIDKRTRRKTPKNRLEQATPNVVRR